MNKTPLAYPRYAILDEKKRNNQIEYSVDLANRPSYYHCVKKKGLFHVLTILLNRRYNRTKWNPKF